MTPVLNVADVVTPETLMLVALSLPYRVVTIVVLVAITAAPVPVSSVNAVKSCSDVKEPNTAALPTEVT
jgi:hypothetical protein